MLFILKGLILTGISDGKLSNLCLSYCEVHQSATTLKVKSWLQNSVLVEDLGSWYSCTCSLSHYWGCSWQVFLPRSGCIVLIGDQCHQGVPVSWWGVICKGVWMDGVRQQAAGYFSEVRVLISIAGGFKVVADHWKDVLYKKVQWMMFSLMIHRFEEELWGIFQTRVMLLKTMIQTKLRQPLSFIHLIIFTNSLKCSKSKI